MGIPYRNGIWPNVQTSFHVKRLETSSPQSIGPSVARTCDISSGADSMRPGVITYYDKIANAGWFHGYKRAYEVDYDETWAGTVRVTSVRALLSIAAVQELVSSLDGCGHRLSL